MKADPLHGMNTSGWVLQGKVDITVKSRLNKATYRAHRCYISLREKLDSCIVCFAGLDRPNGEKLLVTTFVFESPSSIDPPRVIYPIVQEILASGTVSEATIEELTLPPRITFEGEWATDADFILQDPALQTLGR